MSASGSQEAKQPQDAAAAYARILADVEDEPLVVKNIRVEGNDVTHTDFILSELKNVESSKTLKETAKKMTAGLDNLLSLGIFRWVDVELGQATDEKGVGTEVVVRVKEKNRVFLRTDFTHELRRSENTLSVGGGIRNVFGRAEQLQGAVAFGDKSSKAFSLDYKKPRFMGTSNKLSVGVFRQQNNFVSTSSYEELSRGVKVAVSDEKERHTFGYTAAYRDVIPHNRVTKVRSNGKENTVETEPSVSIVNSAVPSFKSALHYTYKIDKTDSPFVPHKGSLFQIRTELAGVGGDVRFGKVETTSKYYFPLTDNVAIGFGLTTGLIRPWSTFLPVAAQSAEQPEVHVSDRFFLGGAMSVRGFGPYRIGPADGPDAVGGDFSAAASTELCFKMPERWKALRELNLRARVYANVGNLVSLSDPRSLKARAQDFLSQYRASVGAGLVLPTPLGRLELNLSHPVKKSAHDELKSFQIGLGAEFL